MRREAWREKDDDINRRRNQLRNRIEERISAGSRTKMRRKENERGSMFEDMEETRLRVFISVKRKCADAASSPIPHI